MEVPDTAIYVLKVIEFMVMRGEKSLCTVAIFMDIFHDRTRYGHTVIGRSSSAYLVQKHQRTRRDVMQDHRSLQHLHHECGFSAGDVVGSSHTGEYLIAVTESRFGGWHIRSHLSHQDDQRRLTQERRLTGHVRTRKDDYLLLFIIKINVIRNEFLSGLHHGLDDRMTTLLYVDDLAVVHLRTAVIVGQRQVCKSAEHVQSCKDAAVLLDQGNVCLDPGYKLCIYLNLKGIDTFLGPKDLLLIFLQFLGYITLGIDKGLLSDPLFRNTVLVGVADLEIISEYVVESYLER